MSFFGDIAKGFVNVAKGVASVGGAAVGGALGIPKIGGIASQSPTPTKAEWEGQYNADGSPKTGGFLGNLFGSPSPAMPQTGNFLSNLGTGINKVLNQGVQTNNAIDSRSILMIAAVGIGLIILSKKLK